MSEPARDPFEILRSVPYHEAPRPEFARRLRSRLVAELGITIDTPTRRPTMTTPAIETVVTPYLAVSDAAGALAFYAEALGASELSRMAMDDGRIGHAEFAIGSARFYLSDEYPELDVRSPQSLGGTPVTLHLQVPDVDERYARAVAAGAESLAEPADQPHGSRHGTLRDPFGHRWMLSTPLAAEVRSAPDEVAFRGIWSAVNAADAPAVIRFAVDVLGFEAQLVVSRPDDPSIVEHSQLRWPEGGVVQVGSANRAGNPFSQLPTGAQNLYVITADPQAVHSRCVEASAEIVAAPASPDYDPGGLMFTVRDVEGNLWTFGTYAG